MRVAMAFSRASGERMASPTLRSSPHGTAAERMRGCQCDQACLPNASCSSANSGSRRATRSWLVAQAGSAATPGNSTTWLISRWKMAVLPQLIKKALVAGVDHARRAGIGAGIARPLWRLAGIELLQRGIAGHHHRGVEQRHLHRLAAAGARAGHQRAQDCIAGHHRGADVHHRRQRTHAVAVGVAVHRDEAALGLGNRVEAQPVGVRAFSAIGRHRAEDQPWVGVAERVAAQAQPLDDAGGEVLDDNIGLGDQFAPAPRLRAISGPARCCVCCGWSTGRARRRRRHRPSAGTAGSRRRGPGPRP